jgi:hypothetical protein
MKLWELLSAFRSEEELLRDVLSKDEWHESFGRWCEPRPLADFRAPELDNDVPMELSRAIASGSRLRFSLDRDGCLRPVKISGRDSFR